MRYLPPLLLLVASTAGAQIPALVAGKRIRVEMQEMRQPTMRYAGTFLSQGQDSLFLGYRGESVAFGSASITRVSLSAGKSHGAGAWRGLKVGAIAGSALSCAIFCTAAITGGKSNSVAPLMGFVAGGAITGAAYGVVIGAIIGREMWTPVYDRPVRSDAQSLGLRFTF
jgi:hypothetical protein